MSSKPNHESSVMTDQHVLQCVQVLPCRAPTAAPCVVQRGSLSVPPAMHVEVSGRITFEHVRFVGTPSCLLCTPCAMRHCTTGFGCVHSTPCQCYYACNSVNAHALCAMCAAVGMTMAAHAGKGAMAGLLCHGDADVSFIGCTFQECGIVASDSCSCSVHNCTFSGTDVGVCAIGPNTTVSLSDSALQHCSEAIVAHAAACVVAHNCHIDHSKINGVHSAERGSLVLEKCAISGCPGFAAWAQGPGASVMLQACTVKGCAKGPFWVADGAKFSMAESCELQS